MNLKSSMEFVWKSSHSRQRSCVLFYTFFNTQGLTIVKEGYYLLTAEKLPLPCLFVSYYNHLSLPSSDIPFLSAIAASGPVHEPLSSSLSLPFAVKLVPSASLSHNTQSWLGPSCLPFSITTPSMYHVLGQIQMGPNLWNYTNMQYWMTETLSLSSA